MVEELEFTIIWETSGIHGEEVRQTAGGMDELNQLLKKKVSEILAERHGCCVLINHEKTTRSTNYAHMSRVLTGQYHATLFRKIHP